MLKFDDANAPEDATAAPGDDFLLAFPILNLPARVCIRPKVPRQLVCKDAAPNARILMPLGKSPALSPDSRSRPDVVAPCVRLRHLREANLHRRRIPTAALAGVGIRSCSG